MKDRKAAGTKRELQVVKAYRDDGWVAFRTPASLGVCDVVAMTATYDGNRVLDWIKYGQDHYNGSEVHMVEVKSNKLGGPYMNFRTPEREALREAARQAGAEAWLCWWPPGGARRDLPESEWPKLREPA